MRAVSLLLVTVVLGITAKDFPNFLKDAQQMKIDAVKKAVLCNVCKVVVEDFYDKSVQRHKAGLQTSMAKMDRYLEARCSPDGLQTATPTPALNRCTRADVTHCRRRALLVISDARTISP